MTEARHIGSTHMPKPFSKSHPIVQEGNCLHVNITNDDVITGLARFFIETQLKGCVHVSVKRKWKEPKGKRGKSEMTLFLAKKTTFILEYR